MQYYETHLYKDMKNKPLFVSRGIDNKGNNKRLTDSAINKLIWKLTKKAEIDKKITVHDFITHIRGCQYHRLFLVRN